jgi:hypothetical protein
MKSTFSEEKIQVRGGVGFGENERSYFFPDYCSWFLSLCLSLSLSLFLSLSLDPLLVNLNLKSNFLSFFHSFLCQTKNIFNEFFFFCIFEFFSTKSNIAHHMMVPAPQKKCCTLACIQVKVMQVRCLFKAYHLFLGELLRFWGTFSKDDGPNLKILVFFPFLGHSLF